MQIESAAAMVSAPPLAGHLLQRRPAHARDLRLRPRHQHERIVPQAQRLHPGMVQRARDPDVRLARQHHLQHFPRVAGAHGDHHLGMGGLEALEHVGQQVGADREGGRELDGAAAGRPEVVHGLAGGRGGVEELLGVRAERAAGRRQRQPGLAAHEQRHAERGLQRPDAGADRGLGHAEGIRGPPEAAEGAHRQEGLDLADLHRFTSLMVLSIYIAIDYRLM